MTEYTIALTGLNAADSPCPGISVMRSLKSGVNKEKKIKLKIIGLAYELLCSTSYAKELIDEVYAVPFPQADEEKYLERIAEITRKTKIDMLVPNLDFEIAIFSKLEAELRALGIRLLLPPESSLWFCKKENLSKLTQLTEIDLPFSIVFYDRRQITESAANFTYPLIIKASNGEASMVYSLQEAIVFSNRLMSLWGAPLIMQKYIKGDEYCVVSLADKRERVLGSVCMKKILKSRNGTAWMGVTAKDDNIIKISEKIIEKLRWVGPIEIEFIKEQASQKYYLIEINPRFPTWIELAAQAGCNLPLLGVKAALHQKVEPQDSYKNGILFSRSCLDVLSDISCLGRLATKKELIYYEDKKSN